MLDGQDHVHTTPRQRWTLNQEAFDKLLVAFDADRETAGESIYAFLNGLNPAARLAFVAAIILVVVGAAWLFVETQRLRRQVTQLQAENQAGQNLQQTLEAERKRNAELNARLDQEKQQREQTDESLRQLTETREATTPAPAPVIASLTLLPGLSRSGGQKPALDLSNDARLVRLQIGIDPEEQYKSFAVELRTLAGRQVWNRENLAARTRRGTLRDRRWHDAQSWAPFTLQGEWR